MRLFWGRLAWRFVVSRGRAPSRGFAGLLLLTVVIFGGGALAGAPAALGAREYSAYSETEKPVLSVLLSEQQNVEEFQEELGLSDGEVEDALAAVRKENEALAREYAESERIVASNKELPDDRIASKIAASDYEETVTVAVARTKRSVEALLPEDRRGDLRGWVDAQWGREARDATAESSAGVVETRAGSTSLRCKVFATQYVGYTRYEVALPHRALKFGTQPRVHIQRITGGSGVLPPTKEVGPWNTYDNYWQVPRKRTMWKNLPRCVPEAQAAYFHNYNRGRDEFGRTVLNPAGVDLTPAVARRMGLRTYQNAWVYVRFPWVRR